MAFRTRNTKLWASKLPESPYNTPPATGAEFEALVSANPFYLLPNIEKTSDAGQIGTGTHFATHLCNDYWAQPGVDLATQQALFDIYGRLWLRAFGGTVTAAAAGTGTKHTAKMMAEADGSQLPGTSVIVENGPEDVVVTGMVAATATLGKTRRERPTLAFSMVGTGNHVNPHGVTGLPAYAPEGGCPKSGIVVKYTDPSSTIVDLGSMGCSFVNLGVSLNNNILANDRCPSDPELTMPTTPPNGTANVVTRVQRQEQSLDIGFSFLLQTTNPEYNFHLENENCTNLQIAIKGPVIGAGPQTYELGVVVPKFNFRNVTPTDDEGNAAYNVGIEVLIPSVTTDLPYAYVTNAVATNFK
jgi:hypothetical protein